MIEVGVFFGMEWRPPSLIAFPRIRAYLRTAFYYFFHFYYFCHFIVLIQVLTRASNNDGNCTIENHARNRTHAPFSKSSSDEARRRFDTKCSDSKLNLWFSFLFLYLSPTNIDLDYRATGGEIVKCQQSIKQFRITKIRSQHILYSEFSLS